MHYPSKKCLTHTNKRPVTFTGRLFHLVEHIHHLAKLQADNAYAMLLKQSRTHAVTLSQLSTEAAIVNLPLPT